MRIYVTCNDSYKADHSFKQEFFKKYLFTWLHQILLVAHSILIATHGLSSPEACGILVPLLGIEPASPALKGGFLTIGTLGKSNLNNPPEEMKTLIIFGSQSQGAIPVSVISGSILQVTS